jgi:hypothetical protein
MAVPKGCNDGILHLATTVGRGKEQVFTPSGFLENISKI